MLEITQDSAHAAPLTTAEIAARQAGAIKEAVVKDVLAALEAPLAAENATENALRLAGLRPTPENRALVSALLLNGLAADKDSLVQLSRAMKLTEGDMAKALFLVQNELRPTAGHVETLNAFVSGEAKLGTQLQAVMAAAEALPEGDAKQAVLRILTAPSAAEQTLDALFRQAAGQPEKALPSPIANPNPTSNIQGISTPVPSAGMQPAQVQAAASPVQMAENSKAALPLVKEQLVLAFTQAIATGESGVLDLPRAEAIIRQVTGQTVLLENADGAFTKAAVRFVMREVAEELPVRERAVLEKLAAPLSGKKLIFPHKESTREDVDRFLTEMRTTLAEAKAALTTRGVPAEVFTRAADAAENGVRFLQDMRNAVVVQLPILLNQKETTAELFVFRDKRRKSARNAAATALLALDEENLGRVEAYIRREEQSVSCQFRLQEKKTEALIRAEMHRLHAQLASVGFRLETVTYQPIDEPFGILDAEPGSDAWNDRESERIIPYAGLDEKV